MYYESTTKSLKLLSRFMCRDNIGSKHKATYLPCTFYHIANYLDRFCI